VQPLDVAAAFFLDRGDVFLVSLGFRVALDGWY